MDAALPMPESDRPDGLADLVDRIRTGDEHAFGELYRRFAGRIAALLWRLTGGDHALAEDLLQETFVRAWRNFDQLNEPASVGGWLRRTAVNLALTDRRRVRPITGPDINLETAPAPPWPCADLDLERAIAALPSRARHVLVLFHLEGLTHEAIAESMNTTAGTSKAQLHRARQLLKEALA